MEGEVRRMMKFLGIEVKDEELRRRLGVGFDRYRRQHHDTFSHFTSKQVAEVREQVRKTQEQLAQSNLSSLVPFEEYLRGELHA